MLASIDPPASGVRPFRFGFAGVAAAPDEIARIEAPWLGGATREELFPAGIPFASSGGLRLFRSGPLLLGHARETIVAGQLAAQTERIYRQLLEATRNAHLYRIWNYVPQINALTDGFENYRAFCQGRSLAFEATLGGQFQPQLPAASAVGCLGPHVDVVFVAGETAPAHFENPEQVPAYLYPLEHGPRPPSFARATVATVGAETWTFISGTSAIKGHETIAPGTLDAQLDCTVDNLRLISERAGQGPDLGAGRTRLRHFKVYLRHARDTDLVRARLEQQLVRPTDVVTYLHSDICRAALNIEIEATLMRNL